MSQPVVTTVDTVVPAERERDLVDGFAELVAGANPEGLLRSELLRGQAGAWRIQTTWRDREALMAVRRSGNPSAALVLLDRLGVEHTHAVFTVEESHLP